MYVLCSCSFGRNCALSPQAATQLVSRRLPRFLCRRGHVHCPSFQPASTSCTHRSEIKTTYSRGTSTLYLRFTNVLAHFYKEDNSQFRRGNRHCGTRVMNFVVLPLGQKDLYAGQADPTLGRFTGPRGTMLNPPSSSRSLKLSSDIWIWKPKYILNK